LRARFAALSLGTCHGDTADHPPTDHSPSRRCRATASSGRLH
jgi:hypothetical protein